LSNHRVLKVPSVLIMCTNSVRCYGLKQAPRAWYECLKDFLLKQGFEIGKAVATLFTRKVDGHIFVCQIYVDDIICGSTNETFCEEFSRVMTKRFEMSMMGELSIC
jgi:hypothetical protein